MSFYKYGIRFECKQCGNCCIGTGYVFIFPNDIDRLVEKTGFTLEELQKTYLSTVDGYTVFRDAGSGACIFWNNIVKGCKIYEARPTQCRTYPFWKTLLYRKRRWEEELYKCPGIGEGRLYAEEEIDELKNLL